MGESLVDSLSVTPSSISIARPEELPEILNLLLAAHIGVVAGWHADVVLRARTENHITGCCALDFVAKTAILHSLAVEKSSRRLGIGSALVGLCVDTARSKGAADIVALTMFWNVNFFRKNGFSTSSRLLLPSSLNSNPLIYDPVLRRATPMIRRLVCL